MHTAIHCNTLQHTATHWNAMQHTATHCNTLQHTATHCGPLTSQRHAHVRMHGSTCPPTNAVNTNATHTSRNQPISPPKKERKRHRKWSKRTRVIRCTCPVLVKKGGGGGRGGFSVLQQRTAIHCNAWQQKGHA